MEIHEKINKIVPNIIEYLLLVISLTAIYGAGIYYIYALNWLGVIITLVLVIASLYFLHGRLPYDQIYKENISQPESEHNFLKKSWLKILYFFLYLTSFILLILSRSDQALISPWQVVNSGFFVNYFLCSLILVVILSQKKLSATGKLLILSAHYLLSFIIAATVYKIGYGFDPFIHQATMELIDKKGIVTPKPFYYLGEYGLIVIFHKLTGISIYLLNKFIVPVLAAIFLPLAVYRFTDQNIHNRSSWLTVLFILSLTFSPFILSTPQNLSYLFLILAITFGLTKDGLPWSFILALATLAIHPLTGIPAIIWWLVLALNKHASKIKVKTYKILKRLLFAAGALVLPLALFISGGSDFKKLNWNLFSIIDPIKSLFTGLSSAGQEDWLLNLVYFFSYNYNLWLILIIGISLFFFYRQKNKPDFRSLIFINLALVIAYLISSQIVFNDLINYEQTNFASRLLILVTIFFLPFIISELQSLIDLILRQTKATKIIYIFFGLTLLTTSLYISYPRIDKYFNSRGYSTSQNDLAAVNLIDKNSTDSYVVLANQQVSVAALKELGFDHYFQTSAGELYFYPIPTGGQLYQYYLDMVYKSPSQETMARAKYLTGAKESYFIINKYWDQSSQIIAEAKLTANSWKTINNEVYIFKY
jgi:hypothetical protein